jgi:hypothetical protein
LVGLKDIFSIIMVGEEMRVFEFRNFSTKGGNERLKGVKSNWWVGFTFLVPNLRESFIILLLSLL